MANLLPPNLPLYLYRYRSISPKEDDTGKLRPTIHREIAALTEPFVWCAEFTKLNDPMEGFFRPSSSLTKRGDFEQFFRRMRMNKIKVGIASFSDTKENELMWTHYAGNYTGICIEFYAHRLLRALPSDVNLIRMGYDDVPPRISARDMREMKETARRIFSQKKFNWTYEREWRILGPVGKIPICEKDVVRSLYLGSRISSAHRQQILRVFRKSDIRIYYMNVIGYTHDWNRIDRQRNT
jgi:Protein of unknown function (DUF2971)